MLTIFCILSMPASEARCAVVVVRVPYLFYLAPSALSIFKIALKMLSKIASQLVHPDNESCLPGTAVMVVFAF